MTTENSVDVREDFIQKMTAEMKEIIEHNAIFPSVVRKFAERVWPIVVKVQCDDAKETLKIAVDVMLENHTVELGAGNCGVHAGAMKDESGGRWLGVSKLKAPMPVGAKIPLDSEDYRMMSLVVCRTKESALVLKEAVDLLVESFDDEKWSHPERRPGLCESDSSPSQSLGLGTVPKGAAEQLGPDRSSDGERRGTVEVQDRLVVGRKTFSEEVSRLLRGLGEPGEQQSPADGVPICH